ncbi:MAG TPA: aminotransferase class I/II-fold pyridoxal phosphate-dependent enzyme [Mycobacteriales bacterium]|nr:aminotransferase class I/II-fold pyridoxal phosphate-dependent enzyme [Mycobacteriales bacterium]
MTYGENTRAVHTPPVPEVKQTPLGLPIYRTAAFAFESAQEYADILNDRVPGFTYSRIDNPTADTFAAAVASLEGTGVTAQPFASGMAAISTTLMAHLSAGDHVVCQAAVYGGTWSLLEHVLRRFGVQTTFVDPVDPAAARAAVTDRTKIVYGEAIANPTLTVTDIPARSAIAAAAGALLFIDSTFATPVVCRPLEHGADIVLHSATKYLGGHSDVTGGVAVGRPELMAPVRKLRVDLGGSLAPDEAFLLHRGISTLPLRMRQHCESATAVATALDSHPAVARVHFPGLPAHHSHELARRLFAPGRFGGMVSIDLHGGREAGMAFCDALQLGIPATSLAGTHTKVSHVASTTHRQLDDGALRAAGIDASTVRISVGLEDAEDLIADMTRALDSL